MVQVHSSLVSSFLPPSLDLESFLAGRSSHHCHQGGLGMIAQPDTPCLVGIQVSLLVTATNFVRKEFAINNRHSLDLLSKES